MRKEVVYTTPHPIPENLIFFYKGKDKTYYLFSAKYYQQIHDYFRYGKSLRQLRRNKDWHKIPSLANVIEGQLNRQLKTILKEDAYAR